MDVQKAIECHLADSCNIHDHVGGKIIFCTVGSCSAQVRALVSLGANACMVGRDSEKAVRMTAGIATVRPRSTVLGFGGIDVRNVKTLEAAMSRCVEQLRGIGFVM